MNGYRAGSHYLFIATMFALCLGSACQCAEAAYFTVGTRDELDLDLDGPGTETAGDLGVLSDSATISGLDLPAEFVLAGVTDFTATFTATGGNLSADEGNLVEVTGLGVASDGETGAAESSLSSNGEMISVSLSSNGAPLWISGVDIGSWRNQFPVSQVTFTGATVSGSATVVGHMDLGSTGEFFFDSPVTSFTVTNTSNNEPVRLTGLFISEIVVPEPASWILCLSAAGLLSRFRRNKVLGITG
jgi:hypothetical protein